METSWGCFAPTPFYPRNDANLSVNHWTLFRKLLNRSIHILIVRMLMYWYTKQECIRWGAEMSPYFTISNRVRQGGILSPSLFAVKKKNANFFLYMDDLSSLLNTSRIGCHIDDVCINHVFYADDLCYGPMQRRSQDLGGGGGQDFFLSFGNLHVAKRLAAHYFAMGVRGHASPPINCFKMVQFGAIWCVFGVFLYIL